MYKMKQAVKEVPLGCSLTENSTHFRFYCPKARAVHCVIFDDYDEETGRHVEMHKDDDGYWQLSISENLEGKWYGYKVSFDDKDKPDTPYIDTIFADPYSKHVTVKNTYKQEARGYIFEHDYNWEGIDHQFPDDPRDLVIYETHLKDMCAHRSSGASGQACYQKFIDRNQTGGINHLKKLGVNCVEFLPLQKFSPVEPPYGIITPEGFHNTWNVYAANYWGYMTSFFFAPESWYASDYSNRHSGKTTAVVTELKNVVKELHREGITVLMDVVYNHTSLFDMNPLTHLMPDVYLRKDEKGRLMNRSGTGNEFRSENPVARKMIIDSLLYWMEEYKVDGFRFDLAALLDKKTWNEIKKSIKKKYPKAVLIAEPWGGYYSPHTFSDNGWASWNDRIRNSIKGADPLHDRGFIFSEWQHETRRHRLENVFKGTLNHGEGGLYNSSDHSVNYLESHDGYTLADFIRIGLNPEQHDQPVVNRDEHAKLNNIQLKLCKFAAICLFSAQGITMINAGQEFARTKVIAKSPHGDPDEGKMDHNSYQKNNTTNWLNFDDIHANRDLFEYYRGLIKIRKTSPALRKCNPDDICFDYFGDPLLISFYINGKSTGDMYDYFVILNGNAFQHNEQKLPAGIWEVIANNKIATTQTIEIVSGTINIPSQGGILLRKLRH